MAGTVAVDGASRETPGAGDAGSAPDDATVAASATANATVAAMPAATTRLRVRRAPSRRVMCSGMGQVAGHRGSGTDRTASAHDPGES